MTKIPKLILASASASRSSLMKKAGLKFETVVSEVDESIIKKTFLADGEITDLATILALAKAMAVSRIHPGDFVIGADQTLLFEGRVYDKPSSFENARDQFLTLRGKTHRLETAVCIVKNNEVLWSLSDASFLTMRRFSPKFLGTYLAAHNSELQQTVGGYKLEGPGLQLFEKIDGDYFSILGLPMLKLLNFLRQAGMLEK